MLKKLTVNKDCKRNIKERNAALHCGPICIERCSPGARSAVEFRLDYYY